MSSDASGSGTVTPTRVLARRVFIFKWVNEKIPAWDQILTAPDVARLIRRQRWTLSTLAILGKFPQKQRFHGRMIGWHRCDVEQWLERARGAVDRGGRLLLPSRKDSQSTPRQKCLFCRQSHRRSAGTFMSASRRPFSARCKAAPR